MTLQLANFKKRTVEVRNLSVFGVDALGSVGDAFGKDLKEEFIQFIVVRNDRRAHEGVAPVPFVVLDQLGLQKF